MRLKLTRKPGRMGSQMKRSELGLKPIRNMSGSVELNLSLSKWGEHSSTSAHGVTIGHHSRKRISILSS